MKYVHVDSVEPGQYLGRTIFFSSGAVMLAEGVQLTVYMITTLRRIGVTMLYIQDPFTDDVEITDVVSEETKRFVINQMDEMFQSIRSGKEFGTKAISTSADALVDEVMKNKDVLVQLTDIRTKDNEMYLHALNVCTISVLVGINMGMGPAQLKDLAIGALLHDIGKLDLIADAAEDPKKHHAWRGFDLLKSKREYNLLIAHAAFQHHEWLDGSGKPRGLTGDEIHIYAKIVAVANIYDNLLHQTGEQGTRMLPHEACEHMMALAEKQLDHEVLIHFLRTVSVYPTGTSVKLSTRETGVVVGQHRGLPGGPVVRVVKQDGGMQDFDVKEIDLAKQTTVFIEQVLV